jgi:hypothetical protein
MANELQKINSNYRNYVRDLGIKTIKEAQRIAPEITGDLKRSVNISFKDNEFKIQYSVPYAYSVHEGTAQKIDNLEPHVSTTSSHYRRLPNRIVRVREHQKKYKIGLKPMKTNSGWITIDVQAEKNPNKWLQKAWQSIRRKQSFHLQKMLPIDLNIEEL